MGEEEGSWAVGLVLCLCGVRVGLMQGVLGAIVLVAVSEKGLVRLGHGGCGVDGVGGLGSSDAAKSVESRWPASFG